MTSLALIEKLRSRQRAFRQDERGNLVFIFAFAAIPIMGLVGAAVDYSRANSAKASMQDASDATALMLAKEVSTLTTAQMATKATDYFKALLNNPNVSGLTVTPTFTSTGGTKLVIDAGANVPMTFMKAMG